MTGRKTRDYQAAEYPVNVRGERRFPLPVKQAGQALKSARYFAGWKNFPAKARSFKLKALLPQPSIASLKKSLVFLGLAAFFLLPFQALTFFKGLDTASLKGSVLGASESGMVNMASAVKELSGLNFNGSEAYFSRAAADFLSARERIAQINGALFLIAGFLPGEDLRLAASGKEILRSAEITALIGNLVSQTLDGVLASSSWAKAGPQDSSDGQSLAQKTLGEKILLVKRAQNEIIALLEELENNVNSIPAAAIPAGYRQNFILLKGNLEEYVRLTEELRAATAFTAEVIGADSPKRYLFIFQNNAEMRGSGGFIGSYAIVDLAKGEVKSIEAPGGGSYDTEAGMREMIVSPEPLRLLKPRWFFWDANWWPDWPFTAEKLKSFLEKSDGPTVDGVIALTPTVLERLLELIGPVELPEYGIVLDSGNLWLTLQRIAEQKPDVTNAPKKIIGDLMNVLLAELPKRVNRDNFAGLVELLGRCLDEKQILLYFNDPKLQAEMSVSGWDGSVRKAFRDYLMVTNTNIGGGKSDRAIKEDIYHQIEVQSDGSIIDSLKIIRSHNASKGDEFTGVRNVDWMRIYVPLGSELIEADGFEPPDPALFKEIGAGWTADADILKTEAEAKEHVGSRTKAYDEFGKTVFANWSQLDPGQSVAIYLKYKLPFKFVKTVEEDWLDKLREYLNPSQKQLIPFSLLAQKQPGSQNSTLYSSLIVPAGYKLFWKYPENLTVNLRGWQNASTLSKDVLYAAVFEDNSIPYNPD